MQTTSIQNLSYEQLEQLIQRLLDEKLAVLTNSYPLGAGGAAWFESLRADILPTEAG